MAYFNAGKARRQGAGGLPLIRLLPEWKHIRGKYFFSNGKECFIVEGDRRRDNMALGENIKKLREENNLTQQQLADRLYVSRQTVCRWESGARCPDLIMAKKLAMEFGRTLDDLIADEDIRNPDLKIPCWSGPEFARRKTLLGLRKKVFGFMEFIGGIFLLISVFLRTQLEMHVPAWGTILCVAMMGSAAILYLIITRQLKRL